MGLAFYDENDNPFPPGEPLRTHHDGFLGGPMEVLIKIRGNDPAKYFTNIVVSLVVTQQDFGEFGDTGWGVKFMYGQRRPTEAEWDLVRSNESITIPNIGTTLAADLSTYHPIWVRVFCPAGQPAHIRENQEIRVSFFERLVGA